jgi:hypothetical protein
MKAIQTSNGLTSIRRRRGGFGFSLLFMITTYLAGSTSKTVGLLELQYFSFVIVLVIIFVLNVAGMFCELLVVLSS